MNRKTYLEWVSEKQKESQHEGLIDKIQAGADWVAAGASFIPVFGQATSALISGTSALVDVAQGQYGDAAFRGGMAALSAIPGGAAAGLAGKGAVLAARGASAVKTASQGTGLLAKGARAATSAGTATTSAITRAKSLSSGVSDLAQRTAEKIGTRLGTAANTASQAVSSKIGSVATSVGNRVAPRIMKAVQQSRIRSRVMDNIKNSQSARTGSQFTTNPTAGNRLVPRPVSSANQQKGKGTVVAGSAGGEKETLISTRRYTPLPVTSFAEPAFALNEIRTLIRPFLRPSAPKPVVAGAAKGKGKGKGKSGTKAAGVVNDSEDDSGRYSTRIDIPRTDFAPAVGLDAISNLSNQGSRPTMSYVSPNISGYLPSWHKRNLFNPNPMVETNLNNMVNKNVNKFLKSKHGKRLKNEVTKIAIKKLD